MANLRLSDLDSQKLVEWPKEPLERVVPFVADLLRFRGRRASFDVTQSMISLLGPLVRYGASPRIGSVRQMRQTWRETPRAYCAMSDPLSVAYRPPRHLPARLARDFQPVYVTDGAGRLTKAVQAATAGSR